VLARVESDRRRLVRPIKQRDDGRGPVARPVADDVRGEPLHTEPGDLAAACRRDGPLKQPPAGRTDLREPVRKYVHATRRGDDERREGFALGRSEVTRVSNKLAVGIVEPPPSMQVVPCRRVANGVFNPGWLPDSPGVSQTGSVSGPDPHRVEEPDTRGHRRTAAEKEHIVAGRLRYRLDPRRYASIQVASASYRSPGSAAAKRKSSFRYVNPSRRQPSTRSPRPTQAPPGASCRVRIVLTRLGSHRRRVFPGRRCLRPSAP